MLRSKYLFKKVIARSSLQFNLQRTAVKTYSTSVFRLKDDENISANDMKKKFEEIKIKAEEANNPTEQVIENKTATQIDIRSSQTGMVEGSRINHYLKKKEIGMTDDESTVKGKVAAKSKDFVSIIFAGGAVVALGAALLKLWQDYFKKQPEDYAYENAEKICLNHPNLENSLGVNYTLSKSSNTGRRNFGSKVEHEPAQKFPQMGEHVELMQVHLYAETKTRKCAIIAMMIKNEDESAELYTPLLVYGITDYDKKHYARKVVLIDYRAQIEEGIDLIRQAHEGYLEKTNSSTEIKFERNNINQDNQKASSSNSKGLIDSISLFGDISSSTTKSDPKNFADSKNSSIKFEQSTDSQDNSNSESNVRVRPKF